MADKSDKFEDTVRNLLRMKPKPHKGKAESDEKEPRPDEPGEAGARRSRTTDSNGAES